MNRNPLPRGRAAESVDWLLELFKFLPPTAASVGVPSIRVPMTLVFRHSKPHTFYLSSSKSAGVTEGQTDGDSERIIAQFVNKADKEAALLGLEGQVDVCAMYVYTQKGGDKSGPPRSRTRIEYFDEGLLRDFMKVRSTKADGLLQLFAIPTGSKAVCVRARYVGGRVQVETRTNVHFITDVRHTVIERAATWDGEEHMSRSGNVPVSSALHTAIQRQMNDILTHVQNNLGGTYTIGEATAYWRVHSDSKLYLLYMPSLLLCHAATGNVANAFFQPESPRVAKPVLAYAGSLPRDYFRCPCCGNVVAAAERAQVPFQMMLLHIQALDEADGVSDGDSAALRKIAQTLDKVSRNPQYYADLYRAAAKANPRDNTMDVMRNCGYPGGDLELDDRLENPAEIICFRLLVLATSWGDTPLRLSVAHYKWVRDNKPKLLKRIKCFVCTTCSLDVSNSAHENQMEAYSQVGPGGGKEMPSQAGIDENDPFAQPSYASSAAGGGGGAGSDLHQVSVASSYASTMMSQRETELIEEPPSWADNSVRKTMSLPLLKPKLDRTAQLNSRPWRSAARGEQARFAPVGALKGIETKPDPKFCEFAQFKLDRIEKKRWREKQRERHNATRFSMWPEIEEGDEEGGGDGPGGGGGGGDTSTFLTASVGGMKRSGPAGRRRGPYGVRLPKMRTIKQRPAWGQGEVVLSHQNAIGEIGAGQAALDAKIGALNARMAKLEGSLGNAKRAKDKKTLNAAKKAFDDDGKTAKAMTEIRDRLLENLPRVIDVFRSFDKNGDGQVSKVEFRQVLPLLELPKYGNAEMDAVFECIDLDGGGSIDFKEMQKLLHREMKLPAWMQVGAKGEIVVEAKNKYSLRKEATVGDLHVTREATFDEVRTWLLENSGRAIDLFRQLDINGDGQIIKAEFTAALPLLGFDGSKAWVLEELFDRLDENGNGSLEYEEMHHQLRRDDIVLREDLRAGAVEFETEAKNFYELRGYDGSLKKEPTGLRRAPPREGNLDDLLKL